MIKKLCIIVMICCSVLESKSQQLLLSSNNGIATGESNSFKKNMYNVDVLIGYQQAISKRYNLKSGIGLSKQTFELNSANSNTYNEISNFQISAMLNSFILTPIRSGKFAVGLGVVGNFAIKNVSTSFIDNQKTITKSNLKGINLAFASELGYCLNVSKRAQVAVFLNQQIDFLESYKNENQKIKFAKTSLSITYFLSLKKFDRPLPAVTPLEDMEL